MSGFGLLLFSPSARSGPEPDAAAVACPHALSTSVTLGFMLTFHVGSESPAIVLYVFLRLVTRATCPAPSATQKHNGKFCCCVRPSSLAVSIVIPDTRRVNLLTARIREVLGSNVLTASGHLPVSSTRRVAGRSVVQLFSSRSRGHGFKSPSATVLVNLTFPLFSSVPPRTFCGSHCRLAFTP